jgi:uncharacterized flavoprotein (TIGR03862 family)
MAAETLAARGKAVCVYDAMPTVGRKFLLAGKSGLNLTHAEPFELFLSRYDGAAFLRPCLQAFPPSRLRQWVEELGMGTFSANNGRVYLQGLRASPLLRAWLVRLQQQGVQFSPRHRWQGWTAEGALLFDTPIGVREVNAPATVLALGGASWKRMGSDGGWANILQARGIALQPFLPANCGFDVPFGAYFRQHYAGQPLKTVRLTFTDLQGNTHQQVGECMVSDYGLEGSLIYAFSADIRDTILAGKPAVLELDLVPGIAQASLAEKLATGRGSRSLSSQLKRVAHLEGVKAGLVWEFVPKAEQTDATRLAYWLKHLPIPLIAPRPIDEAISTAGGVARTALTPQWMLKSLPGVFCAGEMLDWSAPTGGYLLSACFAGGYWVGQAVADWLALQEQSQLARVWVKRSRLAKHTG